MSATVLDLSRALRWLEEHHNMLTTVPDGGAPNGHYNRLDRLVRGTVRLRARLRAIPADAAKQIKELRRILYGRVLPLDMGFDRKHARALFVDGAEVIEFGRRSGKTLMTLARMEWLREGGDTMTEGERRVCAMSTELLEANQPAVGQARSQWWAMAEGLLEKKPQCPVCDVRAGKKECTDVCTLCAFDGGAENTMSFCGDVFSEWKKVRYEGNSLVHPSTMAAARKMAELLDRLHAVIVDELGKRRTAKEKEEPWIYGFKPGDRVAAATWGIGTVRCLGGGGTISVAWDDGVIRNVWYENLWSAEGQKNEWHGFREGEEVWLDGDRPCVVTGGAEHLVLLKDDRGGLGIMPSRLSRERTIWHGFEEGERVRHLKDKDVDFGTVLGGSAWYVSVTFDGQGHRRDILPERLSHAPDTAPTPEPDRRCGTCAYWPKNGPPEGWTDKGRDQRSAIRRT